MALNADSIVVGVDGSEPSKKALERAIHFAEASGAKVHAIHVSDVTPAVLHLPQGTVNTSDLAEAQRAAVWEQLDAIIGSASIEVERVDRDGYPADGLVDYCEEIDADLLVVGTRSRGRLASTVLGSTSLRALERATCDVLVVK